MKKKRGFLSQTQYIAYGFFVLILVGTLLLMLPFASRNGQSVNFLDALFTSTSASCVTGLVVRDTWSQWSLFGQFVIIFLIQIGGLGFVTVGVFFSIVLRRKIGLRQRGLIQESTSALQIGGIVKLARRIIAGTCIFEVTGAVLLSIRFVPKYGFFRGVFYGFFHAVSAFCNAGFDLMGNEVPYNSLVSYYDDWLVNLVIMSLIIIGGLGFIVWDDLYRNKFDFSKYLWVLERQNLMVGMSSSGQILTSLFASVTARTAGFNTVDPAAMTDGSKLLTLILMFIGGNPGSTAGGVKTTSAIALFLYVRSNIDRSYGINVFGRRLEEDAVKRAGAICTINLTAALAASILIMAIQPVGMADVLFETFSAIGTVGMTTGITRSLLPASRIVIILLMYCGRIGSMSFALAFTQQKRITHVQNPVETVSIG